MIDPVFFFFLIKPFGYAQDEKKIKAANKKAEIFNTRLKTSLPDCVKQTGNSPQVVQYFVAYARLKQP